jgi:nicotinamide mononucleotide adenylyltransferase
MSEITVHGRFQPPLHINHWDYIKNGFELSDHVNILITNPFQNEAFEETASWRSDPENNPFTYEERIRIFGDFFTAMGIDENRYSFKPFNIKDDASFTELDRSVPNLVNVYSEWSAKKVESFKSHGLKVIKLEQPKSKPVSGTLIRKVIKYNRDRAVLPGLLIDVGFMESAVPGLMAVLSEREKVES